MVIEIERARTSFVNEAFERVRFEWRSADLGSYALLEPTRGHRSKVKVIRLRRGETKATHRAVEFLDQIS